MQCPECNSTHIRKNGKRKGKHASHLCWLLSPVHRLLWTPERLLGWNQARLFENVRKWHGLSRDWTSQRSASHNRDLLGKACGRTPTRCLWTADYSQSRRTRWTRNLRRFKKNKIWLWTAVDHFKSGILGWVLGDHSAKTFKPLWGMVGLWRCYFYVTDGWSVYPSFIPDGDHIISKTYMTRVEGENTRLRHYLARLHRKTLCYSKSEQMLRHSIRLLLHYLKFWDVPVPTWFISIFSNA